MDQRPPGYSPFTGGVAVVAAAGVALASLLMVLAGDIPGHAQTPADQPPSADAAHPAPPNVKAEAVAPKPGEPPAASVDLSEGAPSGLVDVPVVNLFPNAVKPAVSVANPYANDPDSAARGMKDFIQFNCVGCHAANGAGGMGPSLSDADFIYGSEPQNIFLSIYQGRPVGMPAWGSTLPTSVIWDLVSYVSSISKQPGGEWGKTVSLGGFKMEQVPAEYMKTPDPWAHTEAFSYGQKPLAKVPEALKSKAPLPSTGLSQ